MCLAQRRRLLRLIALQALLLVVLASGALAAQPAPGLIPPPPPDAICSTSPNRTICHFDGEFSGEVLEIVVCGGFVVDAVFSSHADFMRIYDASGELVKETRHIRFTGTLTSRATGQSMIYTGNFIVTLDIVNQISSVTGAQGRLLLPDGGVHVGLAGRVVTDFTQDPPVDLLVAGPKDFDAVVCAALA
jgi:hypothetical protein